MGDFIAVIGVAMIAAVFSVFLKSAKMPVFAMLIVMAAGVLIFLTLLPQIIDIVEIFKQLAASADLNSGYLTLILKIVAVCYLAEFMGQICRDSNESGLAMKIDLAAKVMVMMMAAPIVVSVLKDVLQILP